MTGESGPRLAKRTRVQRSTERWWIGLLWIVVGGTIFRILPLGLGIVSLALLLGIFFLHRRGIRGTDIVGPSPSQADWFDVLKLAPAVVLTSAGLGQLSVVLLSYAFPEFTREQVIEMARAYRTPHFSILALFIAPVLEEALFRGIIFPLVALRSGITKGLIVSSLLFGLLHLNVLGAALFSMVAIALYVRSSSLLIPMGLHFINNLVAVLLAASAAQPRSISLEDLQSGLWGALFLSILGGGFLAVFLKRNWPRELPPMFRAPEREEPGLRKAS